MKGNAQVKKIGAVIVAVASNDDASIRNVSRLFELAAEDLLAFDRGEKGPDGVDVFWSAGFDPGDDYEKHLEKAIQELTWSLERFRESRAIDEACAHWSTPPSRLMPVGHNIYGPDGPIAVCGARKLMIEGFVEGGLVYDTKSPTRWSVAIDGSLLHINPNSTVDLLQPDGSWRSLCK